MIRVLLVDDEAIVRESIREILESDEDIIVVGELPSGEYVREAVMSVKPNVMLLDLKMPRVSGVQALSKLHGLEQAPASVVLTTFDADMNVLAALQRGAVGFLRKSAPTETLISTVRSAALGVSVLPVDTLRALVWRIADARGFHDDDDRERSHVLQQLSARERQIALSAANGDNNANIAAQMFLSETTVRSYLSRMLPRLGVQNRAELANLLQGRTDRRS